ncbi:Methylglutaconyl-CoA hydratase [Candidatus Burkholderia verschuerenii]|uniref:Methylglutaconyl-CoA hydratase n=1 Tax=Candidatus Burkholderia verschuerenii TaxID=242163 RepID=A0A0L0M7D1_9BURK|nr:enoyl-CoA hydratase/isomerase family protein [Candidatus Burkholderia verschuerenii]KND57894.1 Methylglutaconyl-CoA hydratase [Candidatus Burkholderia verschuerenii]
MTDALNLQRLKLAVSGHVARVTLDRADVRNAFDDKTIVELTAAFRALDDDPNVRAIVLAANGPAFCAGADLNYMKRMAEYSEAENRADVLGLATMLNTIYTSSTPVIARVQGDAYAGGMGLVAVCDIAVASDNAHFCLSEARLGLMPATIAPYVIRAMGARTAHRYFITAERFDAAEALRIGFVHQVTSADQLDASVDAIAKAVASNSPNAVRECKQLVANFAGRDIDETLIADTAERIARIRASEEGRDGVRSFLEKRKPSWLE